MNIIHIAKDNYEVFSELLSAAIDELDPVSVLALNELNIEEVDRKELEQHVFEVDGPSELRLRAYWETAMGLQEIARRNIAPYSQLPVIAEMSPENQKLFKLFHTIFPEAPQMYLHEFTELRGMVTGVLSNMNISPIELQIRDEFVPMTALDKSLDTDSVSDVFDKNSLNTDILDVSKINSF